VGRSSPDVPACSLRAAGGNVGACPRTRDGPDRGGRGRRWGTLGEGWDGPGGLLGGDATKAPTLVAGAFVVGVSEAGRTGTTGQGRVLSPPP